MVDLHTHSTFSDGTYTPEELVCAAFERGLSAIALCDHNSVLGLPRFLNAARERGVTAVPGIEFSVNYHSVELHLLGLFIGSEHFEAITLMMDGWKKKKEECNLLLGYKLARNGVHVDIERMIDENPGVVLNRAHIGAELVRLGYVKSVSEAFDKWLSKERGLYIEPERPEAFAMIEYVRSIGAVPVLAHPLLNLTPEELAVFLPKARECGLAGIETFYPLFSEEQTALACRLAEENGLLFSGGSDFHGDNKPDIKLGVGRGSLCVEDRVYDALLAHFNRH